VPEHALQPIRDRFDLREIVGHAEADHARVELREARGIVGLAPRDERGIDRERRQKAGAIRGVGEQRRVEQELGADVGDRAARTAGAAERGEPVVELAHQGEHRRGLVEHAVGPVVERDARGDRGVGRLREACATHGGEVGQHRAERRAGAGLAELRPARDGRVPEIVHTAW